MFSPILKARSVECDSNVILIKILKVGVCVGGRSFLYISIQNEQPYSEHEQTQLKTHLPNTQVAC